jgi:hypothetical protein
MRDAAKPMPRKLPDLRQDDLIDLLTITPRTITETGRFMLTSESCTL